MRLPLLRLTFGSGAFFHNPPPGYIGSTKETEGQTMGRKAILTVVLALMLTGRCLGAPEVPAPSWILMDRTTGTVLGEQEADRQLAPASVTKIMTLLLVMEALDRGQLQWDQMVNTSGGAAKFIWRKTRR